jgi:ribosomal protein S18 acetylase RimI-like enzyme
MEKLWSKYPTNSTYYLHTLAVDTVDQGQGFGKDMMQWVMEQAGDKNCLLMCTNNKNILFYEKFGFVLSSSAEFPDEAGEKGPLIQHYKGHDIIIAQFDVLFSIVLEE